MLLFDYDGVIVDSLALCQDACRHALAAQQSGAVLPDNPFAELEPLTFETLAGRLGLDPERFVVDVTRHIRIQPHAPPPFAGMAETLPALAANTELAVVSATHAEVIRRSLEQHGLLGVMTVVVGGDTPGTKAEKIRALVAERAFERHAMVGDAVSDIAAARDASVTAVGVAWGWQSVERLVGAGAEHVIDSPHGLTALLPLVRPLPVRRG